MNLIRSWIKASRLPSQLYIFLPILAGQSFYVMAGGELNWIIFIIIHIYGIFMQLYIVYANDYADLETDKINNTFTIFSGGSRVLVDKDISKKALGIAAIIMVILSIGTGGILASIFGRIWAPLIISVGITLLWIYSYAPVKMSYRGFGEILQMAGVGIVLPLIGFYAQSGRLSNFPLQFYMVILPTQLACAMATSTPDYLSDKTSHKRTSSVILGLKNVRLLIIMLNFLSIAGMYFIIRNRISGFYRLLPLFILIVMNAVLLMLLTRKTTPKQVFIFLLISVLFTSGIMGYVIYYAMTFKS